MEVVTLRVEPKRKFQIELVARSQHRNINSCVEWAIDYAFRNSPDIPDVNKVWSPDETERLLNLAENYPDLLTPQQDLIWAFIRREILTDRIYAEIRRNLDHLFQSLGDARFGQDEYPEEEHELIALLIRSMWDQITAHALHGEPWDQEAFREKFRWAVEKHKEWFYDPAAEDEIRTPDY